MGSDNVTHQSQRQLRVGESLRHALCSIFLQEDFYDSPISGVSVTVSEVRVSPDLKNATAYVVPLAGKADKEFIDALNDLSFQINRMVASRVKMKFAPKIYFKADTSFENAQKVEELLQEAVAD